MASEEPKPDALATTPAFDYGKLGIAIVEKAREQQRAEAKEAVINGVHSILSDIMAQQKTIARAEERIAKQEARIKALEAGEFTIDLLDNSVVFTNRDLKGVSTTRLRARIRHSAPRASTIWQYGLKSDE